MNINFDMPSIIAKRNVDSEQNPISVKILETKQVMDNHYCVVLNQLPDENFRLLIEGFTEVFDIEKLDKKTYKVDYAQGVVYFHPRAVGKVIVIEYYGIGYELLSASRIFTKVDRYGNILETLEELIEGATECLELIKTLGNAVQVINKLEEDIASGNRLHNDLVNDIEVGTPLHEQLDGDIKEASKWKDQLHQDVADGKVLQPILHNDIIQGNKTKEELDQSIANAQEDIATINATSNEIKYITVNQWVLNSESGMYEYTLAHTMNSKALTINCYYTDTDEFAFVGGKIVDKNNILFKNEEAVNLTVILNSRYYKPQATLTSEIAEEVVEARKGKVDLKTKINEIDNSLVEVNSQLDNISIVPRKRLPIETHDTPRFQEAIDKINITNGGRIYIEPGTHIIDTLVINKNIANKIIFQGQNQKTDYFDTQHETVKLQSLNGNNMFNIDGVTTYFEGLSLIGKSKNGIGINTNNCPRTSLYKCKVYGFDKGIDIKRGIHDIRECEVTANNKGIVLYTSGDSCISDCWINTNGVGVEYNQYCSNSIIKGGKNEWNNRGIVTITGGLIVSNIQFDCNKLHDIYIDGTLLNKHYYAIYPDNVFSISILNNRFLGSGYTIGGSPEGNEGCFIYTNQCSEILINGNNFTSGGRWAQDNGGLSENEPTLGIGPNQAFIKCRDSLISVIGNNFNSQYNISPVMVIDINKLTSKVLYQSNRNLSRKQNIIYDFSIIQNLNKKQTVFYYMDNGKAIYDNSSIPIYGTYEENDIIYNNRVLDSIEEGWKCVCKGTLKEENDVQITSVVDTTEIKINRDIKPYELEVGDYILIGEEIKKIVRIVYKDTDKPSLNIPNIFVDSVINTTYTGKLVYYTPKFLPLNFYKKIKRASFGNSDFTVDYNYKVLTISSDSSETNVILPDEYVYEGQEFIIKCDWIVREVKFKRLDGTLLGTLPSSSTGWWKAIFCSGSFKMLQLSTTL